MDGDAHWRTVWQAINCHKSQLPSLGNLDQQFLEEHHRTLLGQRHYYRAYSSRHHLTPSAKQAGI